MRGLFGVRARLLSECLLREVMTAAVKSRQATLANLGVPLNLAPMEAKLVTGLPTDAGWQFEPKWTRSCGPEAATVVNAKCPTPTRHLSLTPIGLLFDVFSLSSLLLH